DKEAIEKLLPLVEQELHRLAHHYMNREKASHLLQTTALVNEAFIHLIDQKRVKWQNRAHFFGVTAQIMRRILLNYARDQNRQKRGGGAIQISLSHLENQPTKESVELEALDEALKKLELIDQRKSRIVELRFFAGLSVEETAEVLQVSTITVIRDWNFAKAWLAREINSRT
ncbi:MAG: sigma-70 family RNA polymerase sigma factor, partial [Blastocatellia bacterium]|nr:sigma-70 family RNA polymerase sigma factor [Blastocatellia bacterium]